MYELILEGNAQKSSNKIILKTSLLLCGRGQHKDRKFEEKKSKLIE